MSSVAQFLALSTRNEAWSSASISSGRFTLGSTVLAISKLFKKKAAPVKDLFANLTAAIEAKRALYAEQDKQGSWLTRTVIRPIQRRYFGSLAAAEKLLAALKQNLVQCSTQSLESSIQSMGSTVSREGLDAILNFADELRQKPVPQDVVLHSAKVMGLERSLIQTKDNIFLYLSKTGTTSQPGKDRLVGSGTQAIIKPLIDIETGQKYVCRKESASYMTAPRNADATAALIRMVNSPHIHPIVASFSRKKQIEICYYEILPFANCGTLASFAATSPNLTYHQTVTLCLNLFYGLKALHDHGYTHNDVHPKNILVHYDGKEYRATLTDLNPKNKISKDRYWVGRDATDLHYFLAQYSKTIVSSEDQARLKKLFDDEATIYTLDAFIKQFEEALSS